MSDINILMDLYGCWSGGTSLAEGVRRAGLEFTCYLRRISIWYLNKLYVILLEDIILLLFFYIASCTSLFSLIIFIHVTNPRVTRTVPLK